MPRILGLVLAGLVAATVSVASPSVASAIPCPPGGCAKAGDPNDPRPQGGNKPRANAPNGSPGQTHDVADKHETYEDGTSGRKTWDVVGVDANGNDVMLGKTNEGNVFTWHYNAEMGKWHLEMGDVSGKYLN